MLKNIPNLLSLMRLCLIPVFVSVYFSESPERLLHGLLIFLLAGVTDVIDGFLARHNHWVTPLGTVLDPLADKLMLITVLSCLAYDGLIPFFVLAIILIKDISMIIMGIYIYLGKYKTVIPANKLGKAATGLFYLAILFILLQLDFRLSTITLITAVTMKIIAFSSYAKHYFQNIRIKK